MNGDAVDEPASRLPLQDLQWHLLDPLGELESAFWESLDPIAHQYLHVLEEEHDLASLLQQWQSLAPNPERVDLWLSRTEFFGESKYQQSRSLIVDRLAERVGELILEKYANVEENGRRAARRLPPSDRYVGRYYTEGAVEAFQWFSTALASGIIGNIGYDALKKAWGRRWSILRRRRQIEKQLENVSPDEALSYLVKLAIREQCRRHRFPLPPFQSLMIKAWESGAQSAAATVESDDPEMQAVVEIPYFGIEEEGVRVVIRRPTGDG